ncbi:tetratricopeptide repeat protein [uncultured Thiohalocapsa sp.]|uniref:tetratricopeptide repeat protein n=1 Tax=uncultured Thiohalocapsa sp. TaxID=768990 RepID=UPI002600B22F|nr:tetratricopeptide repeat protein [uncultured Thiohalocapsa sp.]
MNQRTEPPAPIYDSSRRAAVADRDDGGSQETPETASDAPAPTRVYAYTPPESVPDSQPQTQTESGQQAAASTPVVAAPQSTPASPPQPRVSTAGSPADSRADADTPRTGSPPAQGPQSANAAPGGSQPGAPATAPASSAPPQAGGGAPRTTTSPPAATAPTPAAPPAPETVATAARRPALAPSGMAPAVEALAGRAEQQRQTGDYAGAAATLERALRIEPQQAYLWNRLARVRLEQGQGTQASNLAARSNALAGNQVALKQNNWDIIATTKRQSGDIEGAVEAERRAAGG